MAAVHRAVGVQPLLSLVFIDDLFDSAVIVTTDVIGVVLVIEATVRLLRLAAIGFPNATSTAATWCRSMR